jgi:hypothetical protein
VSSALALSWQPAGLRVRLQYLVVLAGLALWLAYTRLYWPLSGIHATLPACPFLLLTGHPCPLCGGTRSYAAMWQGDVAGAARYYPLGPLLFSLTLAAVVVAALGALHGRRLSLAVSMRLENRFYIGVAAVFALSWALKLVWLGN